MGKEATFQDFSAGSPPDGQDLWRWLYVALRAAILDGRLKAGARMPSTRSLASQYSLSRGTVVAAFDQLQSEGYTHTKVGSGTYVALEAAGRAVSDNSTPDLSSGSRQSEARLSKWGERYLRKADVVSAPLHVGCAFRDYEPAIDLFPTELWARVASRVLRRAPHSLYGKGDARGHQPLRCAIAEYVGSGTQQALDLLARFLIDPEDKVWMEDPGYPGASQAFVSAGGRIVSVPLDQEGLIVKAGRKLAPHAKLAYVTPANQFPMGVTMSADRRVELLRWAACANSWIIEDEYDAEYRYFGRPVASLQALDRSNCVIYVGTFTKMLFYALRLGFIVLPERIVDAFAAARSFVDRHPPTLDQAILAEFISDGHFGHHVRRMRQLYAERMDI
jgi:GntR family transcriptional regulator/MocR family aminotransferase